MPLFFAGEFLNPLAFQNAILAAFGFCLVASSIYVINDLRDAEVDRLHPTKSLRPIASGKINSTTAIILALGLVLAGTGVGFFVNVCVVGGFLAYFVMNVAYSFYLKNIAIVDVVIIASGFVIRIFVGGFACDIPISKWLALMVFLVSLFMGFAKRRDDVLLLQKTGVEARKNIAQYSLKFIDISMGMIGAVVMVCYVMYTISDDLKSRIDFDYTYGTSIFLLIGLLKYLHRVIVQEKTGAPVKVLFSDLVILTSLVLWVFVFFLLLYLH